MLPAHVLLVAVAAEVAVALLRALGYLPGQPELFVHALHRTVLDECIPTTLSRLHILTTFSLQ